MITISNISCSPSWIVSLRLQLMQPSSVRGPNEPSLFWLHFTWFVGCTIEWFAASRSRLLCSWSWNIGEFFYSWTQIRTVSAWKIANCRRITDISAPWTHQTTRWCINCNRNNTIHDREQLAFDIAIIICIICKLLHPDSMHFEHFTCLDLLLRTHRN